MAQPLPIEGSSNSHNHYDIEIKKGIAVVHYHGENGVEDLKDELTERYILRDNTLYKHFKHTNLDTLLAYNDAPSPLQSVVQEGETVNRGTFLGQFIEMIRKEEEFLCMYNSKNFERQGDIYIPKERRLHSLSLKAIIHYGDKEEPSLITSVLDWLRSFI